MLVDVAVEAGANEFRLVLHALQKQAAAALPRLETIANLPVRFDQLANDQTWRTKHEVEQAFDTAQRRRATAAIAMWRLDDPKVALKSHAQ